MLKTLNFATEVPLNREVRIVLPDDVPAGPAEIVIIVASRAPADTRTLGDLLRSEFFGMWSDRAEIGDSVEYARQLRAAIWNRST